MESVWVDYLANGLHQDGLRSSLFGSQNAKIDIQIEIHIATTRDAPTATPDAGRPGQAQQLQCTVLSTYQLHGSVLIEYRVSSPSF